MKIRDLSSWEAFYWVARESSFAKAAEKMHVGGPLLSKRIAMLEETLGVRLFQRTTRKVSLTHEGRGLFPEVKSFLEDAQGLEDRFEQKDVVAGTIRIACVTAFAHRVLAPLLVEFTDLHPAINFEMEVTDTLLDLIDNQLDIGIRVQEPKGADFLFKKILRNRLVVCASPQYLKNHKKVVRKPEDLHDHHLLMLKVYENCRFRNSFKLGDLANAQKLRCESGLFLTELACQGAGIAIRSLWDVNSLLESGDLIQILPKYPLEPYGDMYAVIPTKRLLAQRVRFFIDFLMGKAAHWNFR